VTEKQLADVRALLAGEPKSVIDAKVIEICNDPGVTAQKLACLMNPVPLPPELHPPSEIEVPESIQRRLIMNNQVSKITPDNWPNWALAFSNGNVPDGIDPYFPEERAALKALGFTDEDLKKLPPAGDRLNEVLDKYADEQYDNAKGMATGYAGGYLFGVAMVTLYAVFGSWFVFFKCKSMPSAIIFFTSSMVYIVKLLAMIKTYIDFIGSIVDTMESKPAEQLAAGIEEYKRALNQGKAFAKDGESMVDRGENLYDTCKDMGFDPNQTTNCVNTAVQFGLDANTLKNRGVGWIKCEMKRVKQAAADQYSMIVHAYEVIKELKSIVLAEAISTTVIAASWGTASGFAIAEVANPMTGFGTCVADGGAPNLPGQEWKTNKKMLVQTIKELFFMGDAQAGKENAEAEMKEAGFNWIFVILVAAGVWLVTTIAVIGSTAASTNVGTMRAIFITAAAIQAILGMSFLWSAFSYTSEIVEQMEIFIRALKRTLSNEGVELDKGDWTKGEEHLGVKDMSDEVRDKFDPCTKQAMDNNPNQVATPIPTPPGGWPTIPPGATLPPGFPTLPPGVTPPPGFPTPPPGASPPPGFPGGSFMNPGQKPVPAIPGIRFSPEGLEKLEKDLNLYKKLSGSDAKDAWPKTWRNQFSEKWHSMVKQIMGQEWLSSAYAQTPKRKTEDRSGYCITNNKFMPDYGCDCRKNGTCFSPKNLNITLDKNIDPRGVKNHASLYRDSNKALALIAENRMSEAQKFTKNFPARIDSLKKEKVYLNNVMNQALAKKKKPGMDVQREATKFNQIAQKAFEKKLASLPAKEREKVMGFMGGASTPPKSTEQALAKKDGMIAKGIRSLKKFLNSLGPLGKRRYPSQGKKREHTGDDVFSDVSDAKARGIDWSDAGVVDGDSRPNADTNMEDYEVQNSDINENSGASIFQIITNRYLKKFMSSE